MGFMADIAMIGGRDSVLLAKAAGLDVYFETGGTAAGKLITKLAKEGVKVIFVTEPVYAAAQEVIERYRSEAFPAIIPVPDNRGSTGVALAAIKANVEKAIGADILFNED